MNIRFELCPKSHIPQKADKPKLPKNVSNSAAEEVVAPDFGDESAEKSLEPITIYIIPSFFNCENDDPNKAYTLRLSLRYSYDDYSDKCDL